MNYADVLNNARQCIGQYCKACPVCNGVACKNQIPGPGAKGVGDTAIRNYNKWAEIRVNMDTLCENGTLDTGVELFGKTSLPLQALGGAVNSTIPTPTRYDLQRCAGARLRRKTAWSLPVTAPTLTR